MRQPYKITATALSSLWLAAALITSCSQNSSGPTQSMEPTNSQNEFATRQTPVAPELAAPDLHQAYYDSELFSITLVRMPANAEKTILARNGQINEIYMTEPDDNGAVLVIDAVPGDGMNPMWREVEIHFNAGFTPHQFFSDEEIEDAAEATNPEITLVDTDEIYRCSVVGH